MDMIQTVQSLESHGLLRTNRVIGNYYQIYCPIHNNGQERKASCGILLTDEVRDGQRRSAGWVHCFSCGYSKSLPQLVGDILKTKEISQSGIDWLKENIPDYEEDYDAEFESLIPASYIRALTDKFAPQYSTGLSKPKVYVSEEELASYRFLICMNVNLRMR